MKRALASLAMARERGGALLNHREIDVSLL